MECVHGMRNEDSSLNWSNQDQNQGRLREGGYLEVGEQRSIVEKGAEVIMNAVSSRAGTRLIRRV